MAFNIAPITPQVIKPYDTATNYPGDTKGNKKDNQSGNSKSVWEALVSPSDPLVFLNLCLVLVTGALAASTFGLWIVTAKAGKRQSSDMERSIMIAERALTDVERAFVAVRELSVTTITTEIRS